MTEAIPEFFPWLDRKKRQVVKDIALALEAPETIGPNIWAAAKDLARVAGLAPSEAQEARHERLKSVMHKESPEGKQDLKDMMVEMAGSFGPGVLGTLRSGGPRNLLLTHGGKLASPDRPDLPLKELLHPSFAITHETDPANNFAGSYLIPRIGAFDPAYSPSTLFNRDAYIARANMYPGGMSPSPWQRMESRGLLPPAKTEGFSNWYELADPRQGIEGMSYRSIPTWKEQAARGSHDTAIFSSPAFRSFAEYEASPRGAGTLGKGDPEKGWSQEFERDYVDWAHKAMGTNYNYDKRWLSNLREFAAKGDKEAQRLLRSAATAPSEYGELKVSGPVPITGDRFAGALLSPADQHLAKILKQRGLDVSNLYDLENVRDPRQLFKAIDEIQRGAFPVKEQSLRVSAGWDPQAAVPEAPQFKIEGPGATSIPKAGNAPLDWGKHFDSKGEAMSALYAAGQAADNPIHPSTIAPFKSGGKDYVVDKGTGEVYLDGGETPLFKIPIGKPKADLSADLAGMHGDFGIPDMAELAANTKKFAGFSQSTQPPFLSPVHMAADLVQNTTPFSGFKPFEQGGMQWRVDSAGNLEAMYHGKWNPEGNIFKKPGLGPAAGSSGDIPQ